MGLVDAVNARAAALSVPREERRTIGGVPWLPFVPFGQGGPVHPSKYHIGQEHALRLSPLYGAVKLLADGVASLPLKIYRKVDGKRLLWDGPSIFDEPEPATTYYDWMHAAMVSLLLHGNALGYITSRDGYGYPQQIVWLPPEHCDIIDDETQDFASPVRARYYYFGREIPRQDLLHVRAMVTAGHTAALSPLGAFKALIEGGLDQQSYSKMWFANGGFPPGVFKNNELEVDADISRAIRKTLTDTLRLRQPLVIGRDWDYTAISVKPEEAQFVQTVQLTATEFAAIYQVPPDMIGGTRGDSLNYTTDEMNTNRLISWSLRAWLRRWENAFFGILPQNRYVKFDVDDLIRVDQATRYANYQIARNIGLLTNDEIRDTEDLAPLANGIGSEALPNDVLVAMSRGSKVLPKTFEKLVNPIDEPAAAASPAALPPGSQPAKPKLSIVPPGGTPPVPSGQRDGEPGWSLEQIARECFGPVGVKQEYLDLVACAARDAGYVVGSNRAEVFSKEQADWIAADALRRPRPIEYFNGNGNGNRSGDVLNGLH